MLKIREFIDNIKISITKYLTPINYLEYCLKACFVLKIKNLRMLSYLILVINLVMFTISILFPSTFSPAMILIATLISYISIDIFIRWRKKQLGVRSKVVANITLKDLEIKDFEVPKSLKKYITRRDK